MDLAKELQSEHVLIPWVTLFMAIVDWRWISGTSIALPQDPAEREKHMWWKCKKWAYACLNCLMGRYAKARNKDKKYSAFSKLFLAQFSPRILQQYFSQISLEIQGDWCSPRVKQTQLNYLEFW